MTIRARRAVQVSWNPSAQTTPAQRPPAGDAVAAFVSTVLADTADVWAGVLRGGGIYHFMTHPAWLDFGPDAFYERHLKHIAGRKDVWYVPLGPLYAYRQAREKTQVSETAPGRFEVSLDPQVYATSVTLAFETGGAPVTVLANGKPLAERAGRMLDRWDAEFWERDGSRLLVSVKPPATLELRLR